MHVCVLYTEIIAMYQHTLWHSSFNIETLEKQSYLMVTGQEKEEVSVKAESEQQNSASSARALGFSHLYTKAPYRCLKTQVEVCITRHVLHGRVKGLREILSSPLPKVLAQAENQCH